MIGEFVKKINENPYSGVIFGIVGIIIAYVMNTYGMAVIFPKLYAYNNESTNILNISKKSVPLTMGVCNFDSSTIEINTSNPRKSAYVDLPHSNNLKGGTQFSYTFWLDTKSYNSRDLNDRIIFMRGINKLDYSVSRSLPLIICPLVKFGPYLSPARSSNSNDFNRQPYLEVYFNTLKNPHAKISLNQSVFDFTRSTSQNPRWFLISIVFQDFVDFNNTERGIQVQSYINDNLVYTDVIKNDSLKVNQGDFFVTPSTREIENTNSFYADITYHNHAISVNEIDDIWRRGVTNENGACTSAKQRSLKFVDTDQYQKLSMNNYLMNQ